MLHSTYICLFRESVIYFDLSGKIDRIERMNFKRLKEYERIEAKSEQIETVSSVEMKEKVLQAVGIAATHSL